MRSTSPAAPAGGWSSPGSSRTQRTSTSRSSRTSTATGWSISARWARQQRAEVLGSALALLHPIAFAEPFGLSVVESMACGTPVIAYPRGSMPEVVDEGVTGFLVDGPAAAAEAVARVAGLDRARCRQVAERRFGAARMVDGLRCGICLSPRARSVTTCSGAIRGNPLLTPNRWPYPINAVMNAGAAVGGRRRPCCCAGSRTARAQPPHRGPIPRRRLELGRRRRPAAGARPRPRRRSPGGWRTRG